MRELVILTSLMTFVVRTRVNYRVHPKYEGLPRKLLKQKKTKCIFEVIMIIIMYAIYNVLYEK